MRKTNLCERPSSRSDRADWYARALEEQASSGLSLAEYAEELGIPAVTLYRWRQRLSAQSAVEPSAPSPFGLVEVSLDEEVPLDSCGPFVVRLGGDRGVEVPAKFSKEDLRRLIRVVESC